MQKGGVSNRGANKFLMLIGGRVTWFARGMSRDSVKGISFLGHLTLVYMHYVCMGKLNNWNMYIGTSHSTFKNCRN